MFCDNRSENKHSSVKNLNIPVGWPTGAYPDITTLDNYWTKSTRRASIVHEETHIVKISTSDTSLITINDSPVPGDVFSEALMNTVTGNNPSSGTSDSVYLIPEVWIYLEDSNLPLVVDSFLSNTQVRAKTKLLGTYIGSGYDNATSSIYRCRMVKVALSPQYFGTWTGGVGKDGTGYTATIKSKFSKNLNGNYPVTTYLRMQYKDTVGKWLDYVPTVVDGTVLANGIVDEYGFVEYIVTSLKENTEYTAYVSDKTGTSSSLEQLLTAGDTSSPFWYYANASTQPMRACSFRTPKPAKSKEPIRILTGSCNSSSCESISGASGSYDFVVWNGDNMYQDASQNLDDFVTRYESLMRNDYIWNVLVNNTNYHQADDHEVSDNYDTYICYTAGNTNKFLLTERENSLYNSIFANPSNAVYNLFTRSGSVGYTVANNGNLVSNQKIGYGYTAFNKALPCKPYNVDDVSRNYSVRWGAAEAIFVNSRPYLNEDGSVEYWKKRATVQPDGTINYLDEPDQFIPGPGLEFLKKTLLASKASVKLVFFSKKMMSPWIVHKEEIRKKFIEIGQGATNGTQEELDILWNKLYYTRGADQSDAYIDSINDFMNWIKSKNIKNVVFFSGDPHASTIQYINKDNCIMEACTSAIGTYRTAGVKAYFYGEPNGPNNLVAVNQNSFLEVNINPEDNTMQFIIKSSQNVYADLTIKLAI